MRKRVTEIQRRHLRNLLHNIISYTPAKIPLTPANIWLFQMSRIYTLFPGELTPVWLLFGQHAQFRCFQMPSGPRWCCETFDRLSVAPSVVYKPTMTATCSQKQHVFHHQQGSAQFGAEPFGMDAHSRHACPPMYAPLAGGRGSLTAPATRRGVTS